MKALDRDRVAADFASLVNMDAEELEAWLETPESRRVGFKRDGGESVGHASGRRIVELLRSDAGGEDDYRHMRRVVGFIRRHRAQEPPNMVTSRWRYSLMNWGHDPLKQEAAHPRPHKPA
ncbi:MAG TPA: DUF3140 domain-containing protein [Allosphingosinicella sp.]|nr:DUF3140 domain-containing protein [Allosphingosinicella sp.]